MDYTENSFNYIFPKDLNMYYCGTRFDTLNHSFGPAIRDHFLIAFIKQGRGILEVEDKKFELNSKNILVMFPNKRIYYNSYPGSIWTVKWLGLYGPLTYTYLEAIGVTSQNPIINLENTESIENIIDTIIRKSYEKDLSSKIDCISLLHRFFAELVNEKQVIPHKVDYVEQAINFMKYNYERGISSADVAKNLNIDRTHFAKLFKKETGYTPTEWLNNLRLKRALQLLEIPNISIGEISFSIGIFEPFYFSRFFKKAIGCSPLEYRKNKNEQNQRTRYVAPSDKN